MGRFGNYLVALGRGGVIGRRLPYRVGGASNIAVTDTDTGVRLSVLPGRCPGPPSRCAASAQCIFNQPMPLMSLNESVWWHMKHCSTRAFVCPVMPWSIIAKCIM